MAHEVKDECGVFGIYGHPAAARLTYYGLYALQHRGQESAGIVASDGREFRVHKGMGLVSEVFNDGVLAGLGGELAMGHVRYSTTGSSNLANAQPLVVRYRRGHLAIAHNGNLVNAGDVRADLEDDGSIFQTTVDTEVVAHLIARNSGRRGNGEALPSAIAASLRQLRGGYALLFMSEDQLIGVRDPSGIRPLSLGRLATGPDGREAYILASETCAFDTIGAEFVRDVAPGEMIVIDAGGLRSQKILEAARPALCVFEYIYLARPDSNLQGLNVHAVRKELGRQLAREAPVEADLVTGVPDSSLSAASGYAEEAGIPYEMGMVKNRYIGRTFIQPDQSTRSFGVQVKLNALRKVVEGKRVVLVDDSIVRGTTSRHIVKMLREAGAREVHLRISSPPYTHACFFGIDTSRPEELVAAEKSVEEIRKLVGADSLHYLSPSGLAKAIGRREDQFCLACFTGDYPVPIGRGTGKFDLEAGHAAGKVAQTPRGGAD